MSLKYNFRSRCPCLCDGGLINWIHQGCDGYAYIDEKGYVECEYCGERFGLEHVQFNCGSHEFRFSFISYPLKNTHILNILKSMAEEINDEKFISHIMSSVSKRI